MRLDDQLSFVLPLRSSHQRIFKGQSYILLDNVLLSNDDLVLTLRLVLPLPLLDSSLSYTEPVPPLPSSPPHITPRDYTGETRASLLQTHEHCDRTDVCVTAKKYVLEAQLEKVFALCVCVCACACVHL